MTCGNLALLKHWKRLSLTSHLQLASMTWKGLRRERWTEGRDWTKAIPDCLCLANDSILWGFTRPLQETDPCLATPTWDKPFHLSQKGSGSKLTRVAGEIGHLHVLTWPSGERNKGAGRLLRRSPTYESCAAAVSPSCGTNPGLLTWLLCNCSDMQPLTSTATLPVDQSQPVLARPVRGCEKHRVYSILKCMLGNKNKDTQVRKCISLL